MEHTCYILNFEVISLEDEPSGVKRIRAVLWTVYSWSLGCSK
jgi:hypothetical protein